MDDIKPIIDSLSPRFIDQLRIHMRKNSLAYKTEQAYIHWIKRFIVYHKKKHPKDMGMSEVEDFFWTFVDRSCLLSKYLKHSVRPRVALSVSVSVSWDSL